MRNKPKRKAIDKTHKEIVRLWGDLEVVDADRDLRVFVRPSDVTSARAKDPGNCVFAKACQRQFDASKVLFFKSVAYVDLPGDDGVRRVERFEMPPAMRALVESFDRGRPVRDVAGFELRKPRPSQRFSKKQFPLATRRKPGSDVETGAKKRKTTRKRRSLKVDLSVRNGMGRCHFKGGDK